MLRALDCGGGLACATELSQPDGWFPRAQGPWLQVGLAVLVRARDHLAGAAKSSLGERQSPHRNLEVPMFLAAAIFTAWPYYEGEYPNSWHRRLCWRSRVWY